MGEGFSDPNYLSPHQDRELVLNQAARWLQEHRNDDTGPVLLVRGLLDLAAQQSPPPPVESVLEREALDRLYQANLGPAHFELARGSIKLPLGSGYQDWKAEGRQALEQAAAILGRADSGELFPLAPHRAPAPPATISLSRGQFARAREAVWAVPLPNGAAPVVFVSARHRVNNDLAAADALLAAAGLAWKAEEAEADGAQGTHPEMIVCDDPVGEKAGPWPETTFDSEADWRAAKGQYSENRLSATAREAESAAASQREADAALGARMRELLADEQSQRDFYSTIAMRSPKETPAMAAWAWLRQQAGLAGGEEAGPAARPPERLTGWYSARFAPRAYDGLEPSFFLPPGMDPDIVYAEAVRRYNLHSEIEAWLKRVEREAHDRDTLIEAVNRLAAMLAEGRPA